MTYRDLAMYLFGVLTPILVYMILILVRVWQEDREWKEFQKQPRLMPCTCSNQVASGCPADCERREHAD